MALELLAPALIPVLANSLGNLISKWTGGAKAQSVDDVVKLGQLEIDKLKALAELDQPHGQPSQWVVDLRASFRYVAVLLVWVATFLAVFTPSVPAELTEIMLSLAGATLSFIIGERMVLSMRMRNATAGGTKK